MIAWKIVFYLNNLNLILCYELDLIMAHLVKYKLARTHRLFIGALICPS